MYLREQSIIGLLIKALNVDTVGKHVLTFGRAFQVPYNLTTLQRSVQSVILGPPCRNQWQQCGVPHQSLATSFPVDLPPQVTVGSTDLVVRSLVSDGCFLYVYTSRGLLKIGSGYGSSIKQHVYLYKPDFFAGDRHGWLGYCKVNLFQKVAYYIWFYFYI